MKFRTILASKLLRERARRDVEGLAAGAAEPIGNPGAAVLNVWLREADRLTPPEALLPYPYLCLSQPRPLVDPAWDVPAADGESA